MKNQNTRTRAGSANPGVKLGGAQQHSVDWLDPTRWSRQLVDSGLVRSPDDVLMYSHSSGDFVDLIGHLNRRDAEELRKLRTRWSTGGGGRSKPDRDLCMAMEYRQRKTIASSSATARKGYIGRKYRVKRSAAIEAIDRGLKLLDAAREMKANGATLAEIASTLKISLKTASVACRGR
jgi:hypothetical protein